MSETGTISLTQEVQDKTADEILAYLFKHPKSKDTLEGIAEWWLERHYIDLGVDLVAKALSQLCSKGIVLEKRYGGGNSHYELNFKQDGYE